jgi:hypothetical protein
MAKAKFTRDEINQTLVAFSTATYEINQNHSFAAGWYEALLAQVVSELPRAQQAIILQSLSEKIVSLKPVQL